MESVRRIAKPKPWLKNVPGCRDGSVQARQDIQKTKPVPCWVSNSEPTYLDSMAPSLFILLQPGLVFSILNHYSK